MSATKSERIHKMTQPCSDAIPIPERRDASHELRDPLDNSVAHSVGTATPPLQEQLSSSHGSNKFFRSRSFSSKPRNFLGRLQTNLGSDKARDVESKSVKNPRLDPSSLSETEKTSLIRKFSRSSITGKISALRSKSPSIRSVSASAGHANDEPQRKSHLSEVVDDSKVSATNTSVDVSPTKNAHGSRPQTVGGHPLHVPDAADAVQRINADSSSLVPLTSENYSMSVSPSTACYDSEPESESGKSRSKLDFNGLISRLVGRNGTITSEVGSDDSRNSQVRTTGTLSQRRSFNEESRFLSSSLRNNQLKQMSNRGCHQHQSDNRSNQNKQQHQIDIAQLDPDDKFPIVNLLENPTFSGNSVEMDLTLAADVGIGLKSKIIGDLARPATPAQVLERIRTKNVAYLRDHYNFVHQIKKIGSGSTAAVKIVTAKDGVLENVSHAKYFAVKIFRRPTKDESEDEYDLKLAAEWAIQSNLHHPNIVQAYELCLDHHKLKSDLWCEVMEYCAAGDLFNILSRHQYSIAEKNCTFKQVVRAVAYLHKHGIAHRDIKPENILLTATGAVKLTDFGTSDLVFLSSNYEHIRTGVGLKDTKHKSKTTHNAIANDIGADNSNSSIATAPVELMNDNTASKSNITVAASTSVPALESGAKPSISNVREDSPVQGSQVPLTISTAVPAAHGAVSASAVTTPPSGLTTPTQIFTPSLPLTPAQRRQSKGRCGSEPYMAPELFNITSSDSGYDGFAVDYWALGVLYFTILAGGCPWMKASERDRNFTYYRKCVLKFRGLLNKKSPPDAPLFLSARDVESALTVASESEEFSDLDRQPSLSLPHSSATCNRTMQMQMQRAATSDMSNPAARTHPISPLTGETAQQGSAGATPNTSATPAAMNVDMSREVPHCKLISKYATHMGSQRLLYGMLELDPAVRMTAEQALHDTWFKRVECCVSEFSDDEGGERHLAPPNNQIDAREADASRRMDLVVAHKHVPDCIKVNLTE